MKKYKSEMLSYGECPKYWPKELKIAQAARHYGLMQDSMDMIQKTLSEDTFRNRYEAAIREAQVVINICGRRWLGLRAERKMKYLINKREYLIEEFITRCEDALGHRLTQEVHVA